MRALPALAVLLALPSCSLNVSFALDASYLCSVPTDCAAPYGCYDGLCRLGPVDVLDAGPTSDAGVLFGALVFTTPPRSTVLGTCSQAVSFELRDDGGAALPAPMNVNVVLSASPAPGLTFYADDVCTTVVSAVPVAQGTNSGTVRFIGSLEGNYGLALSLLPLDGALQQQVILPKGMDQLKLSATSSTELIGTCLGPVKLEIDDPMGAPDPAHASLSVALSATDAGLSFFSDSACSNDLGGVLPLATATTSQPFWAQGPQAGDFTISSTAMGLAPGSLDVSLLPLVHSGGCDLANAQKTRTCNLPRAVIDVNHTFLVYQATASSKSTQNSEVTCTLASTSTITCTRAQSNGLVPITWQTVELKDAHVDRYQSGCPADAGLTNSVPLKAALDPHRAFELVSTIASGEDFNANDLFSAFDDGTKLTVQWEKSCNTTSLEVQVVQVPGFTVTHASAAMMNGSSSNVAGNLPPPDGGLFVLTTWRNDDDPNSGTPIICDRSIRSEVTSPTAVTVTRSAGDGDGSCTASTNSYTVDRVDTGARARVQQLVFSLAQGQTTQMKGINDVDRQRTFLFLSGQSGGFGQALGEAAQRDAGFLGEMTAVVSLQGTAQVKISRGSALDAAAFTAYIVELVP